MALAGLHTWTDAIGNVHGVLPARRDNSSAAEDSIVLGSHYDTVRDAGKYDGTLGVVVAIAAAKALVLARTLPMGWAPDGVPVPVPVHTRWHGSIGAPTYQPWPCNIPWKCVCKLTSLPVPPDLQLAGVDTCDRARKNFMLRHLASGDDARAACKRGMGMQM
jgi:hypothetical protein